MVAAQGCRDHGRRAHGFASATLVASTSSLEQPSSSSLPLPSLSPSSTLSPVAPACTGPAGAQDGAEAVAGPSLPPRDPFRAWAGFQPMLLLECRILADDALEAACPSLSRLSAWAVMSGPFEEAIGSTPSFCAQSRSSAVSIGASAQLSDEPEERLCIEVEGKGAKQVVLQQDRQAMVSRMRTE